jgi:hypothetical protein
VRGGIWKRQRGKRLKFNAKKGKLKFNSFLHDN